MIDNYFGLLRGLSNENKLELIVRLSKSIVLKPTANNKTVDHFFGAFKSEKTAEEIITEIKDSRTFNRNINIL